MNWKKPCGRTSVVQTRTASLRSGSVLRSTHNSTENRKPSRVADYEPKVKSKRARSLFVPKCGIVTAIQVCIDPRMITWRFVNQKGRHYVHVQDIHTDWYPV